VLRPKQDGSLAHFYTLVTRDTRDQEFAANRQMFLTEQGYGYEILYENEIPDYRPIVHADSLREPTPLTVADQRPRHLTLVRAAGDE
jgi:hypothetical protein